MSTFINAFKAIKLILETDSGIRNFIQPTYEKKLTVMAGLEEKKNIPIEDLPLILMGWGDDNPDNMPDMTDREVTEVFILLAIYQEDKESAVYEMRELYEAVKTALYKDITLGQIVTNTVIRRSETDFGAGHPYYFRALLVEITYF